MMHSYTARTGHQRAYFTSRQAVAYERAFAAYPAQPWGLPESAAIDGYRDAKAESELTDVRTTAALAAAHPEHRKERTCTRR